MFILLMILLFAIMAFLAFNVKLNHIIDAGRN